MKHLLPLALAALTSFPAAAQGIEECEKVYDYATRIEKADQEFGYRKSLPSLLQLIPDGHPDEALITNLMKAYAITPRAAKSFAEMKRESCENHPRHQNVFPLPQG